MTMKRTFHPVGQGAFYSETHNCSGTKFTIVYDCGSMTHFGNHLKSIVESVFPKEESEIKPIIDILFISHFHADHINGIKHLKNHCEIRKVVIPLIDEFTKKVLKINNRIIGDSDDDELIDNPKSFFGENVEVVAISENGKENETNSEDGVVVYPSGKKYMINQNDNWFFIPFNYRHDEAVDLFRQTLADFGINLNNIDIETVVGNQDIINAYREFDKDLNNNSMILYSGKNCNCFLEFKPKQNPSTSIVDKIRTIKYNRYFKYTQSGCLYTGDINLKQSRIVSDIKSNYREYLPFIGTIQIPHHGSKASYCSYILEKKLRYAIISYGTGNAYNHPSQEVVDDLNNNSLIVCEVTENPNTIANQNYNCLQYLRRLKLEKIKKLIQINKIMKKLILNLILLTIFGLSNYSFGQTFEKMLVSLPGAGPVQCGDFDSDGKMDLIIQGTGDTPTNLFKNIDLIAFQNANLPLLRTNQGILGNSYNAAKFGDLDNDGLIDIVCNGVGFIGSGTLFILFNKGDGTFTNVPLSGAGRSYGVTEIADFNNDGFLDVYTNGGTAANSGGDDGGAEIIENLGNRSFKITVLNQIPKGAYRTARCVDINKDGLVDIIQTSNTGLETFINKGNFIFTEEDLQGVTSSSSDSRPLLIEDFNNDGVLDIIANDASLGDAIYYKQTDGSYLVQKLFPVEITEQAKYMVAGDLNNDGTLDICAQIGSKLYVFYNNGNFTTYETIESENNSASFWFNYSIALADLDNDGDLDIIASNRHYTDGNRQDETRIYKNNTQTTNSRPNWNATLNVAIYNNDVSFNWKPASDDHTPKKGFKYNLFIGKWDDVTNTVSQIISPSNVAPNFNGIPSSPSLIAYPEMATIDTFAVRRLDKGKYIAAVIQIDQSYKVGMYGAVIFEVTNTLCSAPIPTISNVTLTGGGKAVLTPSGGTTYVWYNVAYSGVSISTGPSFTTPYIESTTSYYVANNDGNCESQRAKITVTVNPVPLSFSNQPIEVTSTIGSNIQFTAIANKPSALYQWQSNPCNIGWQNVNDNSTYSGATTSTLSINSIKLSNHLQPFRVVVTKGAEINTSDVAFLRVTDTCFVSVTDTLIIHSTLVNLVSPNNINTIKVYPNPTKDHITIDFGNYIAMNGYSIRISNSLEQTIYTTPINQQAKYIDLSTWSGSGLYLIHLIDNLGKTIEIRKIILK